MQSPFSKPESSLCDRERWYLHLHFYLSILGTHICIFFKYVSVYSSTCTRIHVCVPSSVFLHRPYFILLGVVIGRAGFLCPRWAVHSQADTGSTSVRGGGGTGLLGKGEEAVLTPRGQTEAHRFLPLSFILEPLTVGLLLKGYFLPGLFGHEVLDVSCVSGSRPGGRGWEGRGTLAPAPVTARRRELAHVHLPANPAEVKLSLWLGGWVARRTFEKLPAHQNTRRSQGPGTAP